MGLQAWLRSAPSPCRGGFDPSRTATRSSRPCSEGCGKPWPEADADVCEAIDFCEYYAREAARLGHGAPLAQVSGERNSMTYRPRGVVAVIAPWNFPFAITAGMSTAALAAGNSPSLSPPRSLPLRISSGRGSARGRCPAGRSRSCPARSGGMLSATPGPRDRVHGVKRGRAGDHPPRGRDSRGAGPCQACGRRDGRQELRNRRRGRGPRRRGPGNCPLGVWIRGSEVLGDLAGSGPRGDLKAARRAPCGSGRTARVGRPKTSKPKSRL